MQIPWKAPGWLLILSASSSYDRFRYIDRLRRNTPCLSEWKKQISVTVESLPPMAPQQQQQLASGFLDTPQLHSHHGTIVDALWSLRDNLLKDSLNIRTRILGLEEL